MIATVSYINMDVIGEIVNREGWGSDDPRVVAYLAIQFPNLAEQPTSKAVATLLNQGCYYTAADVLVNDNHSAQEQCETVFGTLQNVTGHWSESERVERVFADNGRSMMVGDLVRISGHQYMCVSAGFEEV